MLTAIGSAVWLIEELIPRPLPWIKPGLANVATVIAIYLFSPIDGLIVAFFRVFLGAMLLGHIGSAGFFISISSALTSALIMIAIKSSKLPFSIYGVSLWGALFHGLTQLVVAGYLVYSARAVVHFAPLVLLPSVATGIIVAYLAGVVLRRISRRYNNL